MALFRRETLRSLYHRLPSPPHSNYSFRRIDPLPLLPDNAVVYDIGSKDTPMQLTRGIRRVAVDIDPRVAPDIVADAHDMPCPASRITRVSGPTSFRTRPIAASIAT